MAFVGNNNLMLQDRSLERDLISMTRKTNRQ